MNKNLVFLLCCMCHLNAYSQAKHIWYDYLNSNLAAEGEYEILDYDFKALS